jgi:uncharacterized protein
MLLGRSLGGAVAMHLLAELDQQKKGKNLFIGAIIESTFTGISDMADVMFPFLIHTPALKRVLLTLNWDSLSCARRLKTPVLFIHGDSDSFVPAWMSQKLHSVCTSKHKQIILVEGGNHNDTVEKAGDNYGVILDNHFKECLKLRGK